MMFQLFKERKEFILLAQIYAVRVVVSALMFVSIYTAKSVGMSQNISAYIFAMIYLLLAPHLFFIWHVQSKKLTLELHYKRIEYLALYADAFICGFTIPLVFFYPPMVLVLIMGPITNFISVGGMKLLRRGIIWFPIGISVGVLFNGLQFYSDYNLPLLIVAAIALMIHYGSIVYLNNLTTNKIIHSKKRLSMAYDELEHEKERSENLLLNILPSQIAEELKEYGKAEAKDLELVTIIFTDFKRFTEISQEMTAFDLVKELNSCFKAFDGICDQYHVEKIKTIGDSYMAAGGLNISDENSYVNTVLAGIEMAKFVNNRNREHRENNRIQFEMRVGIHTGNVVAGIVGVKKFQYDMWGDTVNTASRMESSGEVSRVNVSQITYDLIKDNPLFIFETRGKIAVKGKGEIEMYFVDSA